MFFSGCSNTQPEQSPKPPPPLPEPQPISEETQSNITVSNQTTENDSVVIDSVFLDKPGFVVVHRVNEEGNPGEIIGNSELLVGSQTNVAVELKGFLESAKLIAMLHYDDNNDKEYGFPKNDAPAKIGREIVLAKFHATLELPKITGLPSIKVFPQTVEDGNVTIKFLLLDKPGYAVIHLVLNNGKPGIVIGNSELLEGIRYEVIVPINSIGGAKELIAMLHYDDNNDKEYGFPDEDAPVKVDGKIILQKFEIIKTDSVSCESDEECELVGVDDCCSVVSINKNFKNEITPAPKVCKKLCSKKTAICTDNKCTVSYQSE